MVYMSGADQPVPSVPSEGQILMAQKKNAVLPVRSKKLSTSSVISSFFLSAARFFEFDSPSDSFSVSRSKCSFVGFSGEGSMVIVCASHVGGTASSFIQP